MSYSRPLKLTHKKKNWLERKFVKKLNTGKYTDMYIPHLYKTTIFYPKLRIQTFFVFSVHQFM